jgi:hypothetical protein
MEILPALKMKIKWLVAQTDNPKMSRANVEYIRALNKAIHIENCEEIHSSIIIRIDALYEFYRRRFNENDNRKKSV